MTFIQMGKDEMSIINCHAYNLKKMMLRYLPHVLTPEGEKFIHKLTKKGISFGDVFGFGKKSYNPYSKVYNKKIPLKIDKKRD